jgi:hypothetical protein
MKITFFSFRLLRFISCGCLAAVFIVSLSLATAEHQPASTGADIQREAMQKLAFLTGRWSGPVTIMRGPGEPLHLTHEPRSMGNNGMNTQPAGAVTRTDFKFQISGKQFSRKQRTVPRATMFAKQEELPNQQCRGFIAPQRRIAYAE